VDFFFITSAFLNFPPEWQMRMEEQSAEAEVPTRTKVLSYSVPRIKLPYQLRERARALVMMRNGTIVTVCWGDQAGQEFDEKTNYELVRFLSERGIDDRGFGPLLERASAHQAEAISRLARGGEREEILGIAFAKLRKFGLYRPGMRTWSKAVVSGGGNHKHTRLMYFGKGNDFGHGVSNLYITSAAFRDEENLSREAGAAIINRHLDMLMPLPYLIRIIGPNF
jgi:hypothetical protein